MRRVVCRWISVAALVASALPAQSRTVFEWPVAPRAVPGVNRQTIDSIHTEIQRGDYGSVDRFLVIHRGRIVADHRYSHDYDRKYGDSAKVKNPLNASDFTGAYNYFNPWWHPTYRRGELHTLQSVTKTITSIIIGVATTRGDFPSIETPVLAFFDTTRVRNIDDRKRRMTVRHLLTMTGGLDWNENLPYIDPRNNAVVMEASHDWVDYAINLPMGREPGASFNYSSGETQLLSHIFRRATGVDIEEYAARHLFGPLGITHWYWKRTPIGLIDTEGGLYLEARDLAKLWYLFLADGMWRGHRIVSSDWVQRSVTPAVAVGNRPGGAMYGLKWWLYPLPGSTERSFIWSGSGFGGQLPMAFPDRDLVVVFNAWNILPGEKGIPLGRMHERLARAVPARKGPA